MIILLSIMSAVFLPFIIIKTLISHHVIIIHPIQAKLSRPNITFMHHLPHQTFSSFHKDTSLTTLTSSSTMLHPCPAGSLYRLLE